MPPSPTPSSSRSPAPPPTHVPPATARSPVGMIRVVSYTPFATARGVKGAPLCVRINFDGTAHAYAHVRLVVGRTAVKTDVRQLADSARGEWQLDAEAPLPAVRAPVSVQALDDTNAIIDSVTFGEFCYYEPPARASKRPRDEQPPTQRKRAATNPSPPPAPAPRPRRPRLHRRHKSHTPAHAPACATPVLDLATPLEGMCRGWSAAELAAGRRLVRFRKSQEGRTLLVSCAPVAQEHFREADTVISCIYRAETDSCFVTSVDIIYLLERLTDDEFPVEEKNRIRRNLEGLRPTTVAKHKPGSELFFQRIMDFPDPKPRNIEKDLKVFDWVLLGQALDKILSKYSVCTASPPASPEPPAEPSFAPSSPLSSPVDARLTYPPADGSPAKYEPEVPYALLPGDLDALYTAPSPPAPLYATPPYAYAYPPPAPPAPAPFLADGAYDFAYGALGLYGMGAAVGHELS